MAEAGFWVAWGIPTQGRERQALDLLNESRVYLARLAQDGQIERFDIAILKPQTTELGGFILIQGTQEQIDSLRRDNDFQRWVPRSNWSPTGSGSWTPGSIKGSTKRRTSTNRRFERPA